MLIHFTTFELDMIHLIQLDIFWLSLILMCEPLPPTLVDYLVFWRSWVQCPQARPESTRRTLFWPRARRDCFVVFRRHWQVCHNNVMSVLVRCSACTQHQYFLQDFCFSFMYNTWMMCIPSLLFFSRSWAKRPFVDKLERFAWISSRRLRVLFDLQKQLHCTTRHWRIHQVLHCVMLYDSESIRYQLYITVYDSYWLLYWIVLKSIALY